MKTKEFARQLRKNSTEAEKLIWYFLRNRQFSNFKFRRQYAVGKYIVDFVCLEKNLIIELDGSQHMENVKYDTARTTFLESRGYKVLRFWDNDVLQKTPSVLEVIYQELDQQHINDPSS